MKKPWIRERSCVRTDAPKGGHILGVNILENDLSL